MKLRSLLLALTVVYTLDSAAWAQASWVRVSTDQRVSLDYVTAVELVEGNSGSNKVVSLLMPSRQFRVTDPAVFGLIESAVNASTDWLKIGDSTEVPSGIRTRRFLRQAKIVAVEFTCSDQTSCRAYVDGSEESYRRILADDPTAVTALRKSVANTGAWLLFDDPGVDQKKKGFEIYIARTALRRIDYTCPQQGGCIQAEAYFSGSGSRRTTFKPAIDELKSLTQ
jgi:hypothetical protein